MQVSAAGKRYLCVAVTFIFCLVAFEPAWSYSGPPPNQPFPRIANYHIAWNLTDDDARQLAKWDVVILDMETEIKSLAQVKEIREYNPNVILLAYITSEDINQNAGTFADGPLRQELATGISPEWYLKKNGQRLTYWPGTYELNVSDLCPTVNGEQFNTYLAHFVASKILATGLWDGVFYDNVWEGISWLTGPSLDLSGDGVPDTNIDTHWNNGLLNLIQQTRAFSGNQYLVVGNGYTKIYHDALNGTMLESFPHEAWPSIMSKYVVNQTGASQPRLSVINANSGNTNNEADYRQMRFGLASTLLGNGFYSFDYGDQNHDQLWWYDEYDQKLGTPLAPAIGLNGATSFQPDVWRRDFTNGIALLNSTNKSQTVDLGGDYEKITGTQDPTVNDGSIVDSVVIPPMDGLIIFKTFQSVDNVFFANGSFLRFYAESGARARNGFFAYESNYPSGTSILNADLADNGTEEKLTVINQRLQMLNPTGQVLFTGYPFGPSAPGTLAIAVGNVFPGTTKEIVAASSASSHLVIYNYQGQLINDQAYPLGQKYHGGFTAAVIKQVPGVAPGTVVATTKGVPTEVGIYDQFFIKPRVQFYPFGKSYTGGATVTTGDFNGDNQVEIAVDGFINGKQEIRIFTLSGTLLHQFTVQSLFGGTSPLPIGTATINQSEKDEITVATPN